MAETATDLQPSSTADISPVGSPWWWLQRLSRRMNAREASLVALNDYYEGKHRLLFATAPFRRAFGQMFDHFADNWVQLVVDAVEERLNIQGFRLDPKQEASDDEAWDIWQRNHMDSQAVTAHTEALVNGECAALVWWDATGEYPQITIEHPREMIVETAPGYRMERRAALKRWVTDDGFIRATLYLPDAIYKYSSAKKVQSLTDVSYTRPENYVPYEVPGERWPLPNRLGVVPVVPIRNRPRLLDPCDSEIRPVIPVQDAVNKAVLDMMVASEFAGFPQRWATGIEVPTDPETGQSLEMFKAAVDRLWLANSAEGEENTQQPQFGQFEAADLGNYVKAVEMLVQHIASQTRTPPHYFYLSGDFPSGDAIKSAETGLVAKTRRKMKFFGEDWEQVMSVAFAVAGDEAKAAIYTSEVVWADPESRSFGELIDGLMKQQSFGVPQVVLWEKAGYSPAEIARFKKLREEEAALNPTPVVPVVIPPAG